MSSIVVNVRRICIWTENIAKPFPVGFIFFTFLTCLLLECTKDQILLDGICQDRAAIGERCLSTRQCPETSYCIAGRCNCKRGEIEFNGRCIREENIEEHVTFTTKPSYKKKIVPNPSKPIKPKNCELIIKLILRLNFSVVTKCLHPTLISYRDPVSDRVLFCSPLSRSCPRGYYCQMNVIKQQYICCGYPETRKGGISTKVMSKDKDGNSVGIETLYNWLVCPTGRIPYLLNGQPQRCAKSRCAKGYQCVFSGKDYFCCSQVTTTLPTPFASKHKN